MIPAIANPRPAYLAGSLLICDNATADKTSPNVEKIGPHPQQTRPKMLQVNPAMAMPLVGAGGVVASEPKVSGGGDEAEAFIPDGASKGGVGRTMPNAVANSGKVERGFQGASPNR